MENSVEETKSAGGIVLLAETEQKKPSVIKEIMEVGSETLFVKKGQKALFIKADFDIIVFEGKQYLIGSEENILATIEE